MSKPQPAPQRPEDDQPPVSREELDVIRERMETFERDRKVTRPADPEMERMLRRYPAP